MRKSRYPGGLTRKQWQALPNDTRWDLARRAQCDLLGSYRHCSKKLCRRARTCAGDAAACRNRLWRLTQKKSKTLRREYARMTELPDSV